MNIILKGLKATTKFIIGTFAAGAIAGVTCSAFGTQKARDESAADAMKGGNDILEETGLHTKTKETESTEENEENKTEE